MTDPERTESEQQTLGVNLAGTVAGHTPAPRSAGTA